MVANISKMCDFAHSLCYSRCMKITTLQDAIHIVKPEGTDVHYYLFDDYELMYNDQAPHTTQTWHHHKKIWEALYMIAGELTAHWREDGEEKSQLVKAGDVIETERTPHTFTNDSNQVARFLCIKLMPTGKNYREVFKADKVLD